VVISDDLDMLALADNFDLEEIMRLGIRASVDMFIIGNDFLKAKRAISITQDLMDREEEIARKLIHSSKRIEAMRKRFLGKPMVPDSHLAKSLARSRPHLELIKGCR
jgi:beta-N-acetylhexosaminidase